MGVGGRRRSRRAQGKAPAGDEEEEGRGCPYAEMTGELVKACRWEARGGLSPGLGEEVAQLMGGGNICIENTYFLPCK